MGESEVATERRLHVHERRNCELNPTGTCRLMFEPEYLWVLSMDNGYLQCETHTDMDWGLIRWVPIEWIPIPTDNTS